MSVRNPIERSSPTFWEYFLPSRDLDEKVIIIPISQVNYHLVLLGQLCSTLWLYRDKGQEGVTWGMWPLNLDLAYDVWISELFRQWKLFYNFLSLVEASCWCWCWLYTFICFLQCFLQHDTIRLGQTFLYITIEQPERHEAVLSGGGGWALLTSVKVDSST